MTYARARLWLGISGVGTMVVIALVVLVTRFHESMLPRGEVWGDKDVWGLVAFIGAFLLVMFPFDLLGGFLLPRHHRPQSVDFGQFFGRWMIGVALQSILFMFTGIAILAVGRLFGLPGVLLLVCAICLVYLTAQGYLMHLTTNGVQPPPTKKLRRVEERLRQLGFTSRPLEVVSHSDPGFTGGVTGLPGNETVIVPRSWFHELTPEQLATAIARRHIAIDTRSRTRGILSASLWVLAGFTLAALLPGAGVRSVAQLITTSAGFTVWTFLGLLLLPTISRRASYSIDSRLLQSGTSQELLDDTLRALDRLQDDEPQRPTLVETIFHPVPSVTNRREIRSVPHYGSWHAARMVLFLSWACLGLLSRAVHCNAGRPELWVMLPTD